MGPQLASPHHTPLRTELPAMVLMVPTGVPTRVPTARMLAALPASHLVTARMATPRTARMLAALPASHLLGTQATLALTTTARFLLPRHKLPLLLLLLQSNKLLQSNNSNKKTKLTWQPNA